MQAASQQRTIDALPPSPLLSRSAQSSLVLEPPPDGLNLETNFPQLVGIQDKPSI